MILHHAVDILENVCWRMSPPINRGIPPDAKRAYGVTDSGVHWKKNSRQELRILFLFKQLPTSFMNLINLNLVSSELAVKDSSRFNFPKTNLLYPKRWDYKNFTFVVISELYLAFNWYVPLCLNISRRSFTNEP